MDQLLQKIAADQRYFIGAFVICLLIYVVCFWDYFMFFIKEIKSIDKKIENKGGENEGS